MIRPAGGDPTTLPTLRKLAARCRSHDAGLSGLPFPPGSVIFEVSGLAKSSRHRDRAVTTRLLLAVVSEARRCGDDYGVMGVVAVTAKLLFAVYGEQAIRPLDGTVGTIAVAGHRHPTRRPHTHPLLRPDRHVRRRLPPTLPGPTPPRTQPPQPTPHRTHRCRLRPQRPSVSGFDSIRQCNHNVELSTTGIRIGRRRARRSARRPRRRVRGPRHGLAGVADAQRSRWLRPRAVDVDVAGSTRRRRGGARRVQAHRPDPAVDPRRVHAAIVPRSR